MSRSAHNPTREHRSGTGTYCTRNLTKSGWPPGGAGTMSGDLGDFIPSNLLFTKWEAFPVLFHTFITLWNIPRKGNPKVWSDSKHDFKNCQWSLKALEAPYSFHQKRPRATSSPSLLTIMIRRDHTLHQDCSDGQSGEKLRFRKQCGTHKHKEGIWGVLLDRGVDGKGAGVTW